VWSWLKTNHESATAGAAILTNLLTVGALILTLVTSTRQLHLAQASLQTSQASLQNSLIYNMQKDERAIAAQFLSGTTNDTAPIFAEMQSVFMQRQLGSIPGDVWPVFTKDFCGIMSSERLRRDWKNIGKNAFSSDFVSFMDEHIMNPASPDCTGGKP
jgi:hypothetical protein